MSDRGELRWRSTLVVRAQRPVGEQLAAIEATEADRVLIDLDDTVAPSQKATARDNLSEVLALLPGQIPGVVVRINSPSHNGCLRDLEVLFDSPGIDRITSICVPRPSDPAAVAAIDWVICQLAARSGTCPQLEIQLESPRELMIGGDILAASDRIHAVAFGHGDFADAMTLPFLAHDADGPLTAHMSRVGELAMFQVRITAGTRDVVALDGPHPNDYSFRSRCERARGFGFQGIWCVTEEQVGLANQLFSFGEREIARARHELAITADGTDEPSDGSVYDAPRVNISRRILAAEDGARDSDQGERGS